jgi:hypothetical protein
MKSTFKTHDLLRLSLAEYQQDCLERYMRWCINLSKKHKVSLQSIMANAKIANYYNAQFKEIESGFITTASLIFNRVSTEAIKDIFEEQMVDLYNAYPSALMEDAATLKIENQIILN